MTTAATDGLLLLDKPSGISSHDAVLSARRSLGEKRIGHAGTLDPFATGLLVLLTGRATRLPFALDIDAVVKRGGVDGGQEPRLQTRIFAGNS